MGYHSIPKQEIALGWVPIHKSSVSISKEKTASYTKAMEGLHGGSYPSAPIGKLLSWGTTALSCNTSAAARVRKHSMPLVLLLSILLLVLGPHHTIIARSLDTTSTVSPIMAHFNILRRSLLRCVVRLQNQNPGHGSNSEKPSEVS